MRSITTTEARTQLSALLDAVDAGEEIVITRRGRWIAVLKKAHGPLALKGKFRGVARTAARDDELYSTGERWNAQ